MVNISLNILFLGNLEHVSQSTLPLYLMQPHKILLDPLDLVEEYGDSGGSVIKGEYFESFEDVKAIDHFDYLIGFG